MFKDILINNAKYLIFRREDNSLPLSCKDRNLKNKIILPETNTERYYGFELNSHHFTTKYHREYVLPALNELIGLNFDPFNYYLNINFHKRKGVVYDLSYLYPTDDNCLFECISLQLKTKETCKFNGLVNRKLTGYVTEYHNLFYGAHSCTITKNLYKHNNKTIFISCDSQMIPSLPVICSIYK